MPATNIVSINTAAKIIGLTPKTVRRLIDEEGAPCKFRGHQGKEAQVDTVQFIRWYEQWVNDSGERPFRKVLVGKVKQETIRLNLMNTEKLKALVPKQDVEELFENSKTILRGCFEGKEFDSVRGELALAGKLQREFARLIELVDTRLVI